MYIAGNYRLVMMVVLFVVSAWCLGQQNLWAEKRPASVDVRDYGQEQAIIDAIVKKSHVTDNHNYPNELDHILAALIRRAYPTPKTKDLVQGTVGALCKEAESRGKITIPKSRRQAWETTVAKTKSFESVLGDMETMVAKKATRKDLVDTGLVAMLQATGCRHANVFSGAEAEWIMKLFEANTKPSKEFGLLGVGVSRWPAIQVLPNTSAAKAGMQNGDVMLRIDSQEAKTMKTGADALKILRGPANTTIDLTVKRGDKTLTFKVRRAPMAERIDALAIQPDVIFILIPTFEGSGIAKRVKELVNKHVTDATSCVILDLRNNMGGRVEEVNGVADIFLDDKNLKIYQFANGRQIAFRSKPGASKVPILVLTNRHTGCGAEMLAMALRDNRRATILGERTAGLLSGYDFEKLKDGRMVVFRSEPTVLSPTGKDYSETGISPDIEVKDDSLAIGSHEVIARALQLVRTLKKKDATRADETLK